ncbi:Sugar transporter ERD6-like 17 [Linum perenne]
MSYTSPAQSGIMEDLGLSVAANEWWLYMGRLSIGFGVGFVTYMVPIYIAEITPKEYRGGFAYASQLLANCGVSIVYLMGNVVSWRKLAIIGLVPAILQLMGLFFVPESPRWLAQVGRGKEFEASLKSLRGKDTDINHEKQEIQEMVDAFNDRKDAKLTDLFQKKYAYSLTVPAAAVGLFLMDYAGRKPVLMVSAGGMCLCSILVGVAFVLQGLNLLKNLTPIMTVLGITLYIATFSIGLAGVPWIIMSEIFPMSVKAVAGSLVTLVCWLASWVVTYTFNFMFQWSPAGTFFIFAGMCGASIMFTWKLVPETKGMTLEEIQSSMIGL